MWFWLPQSPRQQLHQGQPIRPDRQPLQSPTAPATWRTYRYPVHGYVIDVGPGWAIDDSDKSTVVLISPTPWARLQVFGPYIKYDSIDEFVEETVEFRRNESKSLFQMDSRSDGPVEGGFGYSLIEYRSQKEPQFCIERTRNLLLLVRKSRFWLNGYEIIGRACEQSVDLYMPIIETMQNNFAAGLREGRR